MFIGLIFKGEFRFVKSIDHKYIQAFGKNLRKLRKENDLSQEDLANDADIPINQIGRIERGEINTTISTLFVLAKALSIEVKDLFDFN